MLIVIIVIKNNNDSNYKPRRWSNGVNMIRRKITDKRRSKRRRTY